MLQCRMDLSGKGVGLRNTVYFIPEKLYSYQVIAALCRVNFHHIGLGSPDEYQEMIVSLRPGMIKDRDAVIRELIGIQYDRNDMDLGRGCFRVRGDVVEIYPAQGGDYLIRVEFFGDEIDRIAETTTSLRSVKDAVADRRSFSISSLMEESLAI